VENERLSLLFRSMRRKEDEGLKSCQIAGEGSGNIGFSHDCVHSVQDCLLAVPNSIGKIPDLTNLQPIVLLLSTTYPLLSALGLQRSGRPGL